MYRFRKILPDFFNGFALSIRSRKFRDIANVATFFCLFVDGCQREFGHALMIPLPTPTAYSELTRRLGFEYDGMVLWHF